MYNFQRYILNCFKMLVLISLSYINLYAKVLPVSSVPDSLYIGQVIQLELNLEEYKPENIFFDHEQKNQQIEVYDVRQIKDKPWHYLLRIAPFDTGFVSVEKLPLYLMRFVESKAVYDTLYLESFNFNVKTSLSHADTSLVDIFAPSSYKLKFFDYLFPAIILTIIGVVLYFLIKVIKKLKNKEEIKPVFVDNRPAWMKAVELLEQLKMKNYINSCDFLNFYFDLSHVLRYFIEHQFRIKALEMTTTELKNYFNKNYTNYIKETDSEDKAIFESPLLLESNYKEILKILNFMDKVKFAKYSISTEEAIKDINWVESYILSFKTEEKGSVEKKNNSTTKNGGEGNV